jgi:hypothetical protein
MTRAVCVHTRALLYGEPALQIRTNTVSAQERGERERKAKAATSPSARRVKWAHEQTNKGARAMDETLSRRY